jgi:hypothetical protein
LAGLEAVVGRFAPDAVRALDLEALALAGAFGPGVLPPPALFAPVPLPARALPLVAPPPFEAAVDFGAALALGLPSLPFASRIASGSVGSALSFLVRRIAAASAVTIGVSIGR